MADQTEILTDSAPTDDAPYGKVMFTVFATAVVLVSTAVALLSVSSTWWMLGVVFGIHLVATCIVCVVIARALLGRTDRRALPPFLSRQDGEPSSVADRRPASLAHAA